MSAFSECYSVVFIVILDKNLPAKSDVYVAYNNSMVLFRVEGLGNMNNTKGLYNIFQECSDKGIVDVCINLEKCEGVDSTFMGTLLLMFEEAGSNGGNLYVINASDYVKEKLDELGVSQIININSSCDIPELEYCMIEETEDNKERMCHILKAHEELIKNNEENEKKFKSFIKALKSSFK